MAIDDPEFQRFARALALTESGDKETAWGDDAGSGRDYLAAGRWQIHPAFFYDYMPTTVNELDSWNTVFLRTLHYFWRKRTAAGRDAHHIAMEFHLGLAAVAAGRWAQGYAADFQRYYLELPVGSA